LVPDRLQLFTKACEGSGQHAQWIEQYVRRRENRSDRHREDPGGEGKMKTMKWTQRICIGAGLAVTSMFAVPAVAGADATCYTGCTPPAVSPNVVTPPATTNSDGVQPASVTVNGSSSLPFTGADIGELAAVGVGAVVIGGVLTRRRRRTA
jgi:hypothetical protein